MPKFFVDKDQIADDIIKVTGQDVNHIKKVLRYQIDDEIEICNKDTTQDYIARIEEITAECIICRILREIDKDVESSIKVTIFQGLPKSDKMELIIQKSVELGVNDITPLAVKRCVVKLNDKDKVKKLQRWQKISEVAAKQCGRNIIPKINNIVNIKELSVNMNKYDLVLVAYENETNNYIKNVLKNINIRNNEIIKIAVVIGPEGGLEESEVNMLSQNGAKVISLGKRILRTETVALNVLSNIMYELEN